MSVRARTPALWLGLALAALAGGSVACSPDPVRPNVLLISLDSVRRDLLGCYGGGSPHAPGISPSPHLDALAAQGVRMERAYSTTSWTLPAHLSLFSGAPELVHGVDSDRDRLSPDLPLLAQTLAGAGYRTAGFYSGPYLEPTFGMGRGFERYEGCYGERLSAARAAEGGAGESYDPKAPSRAVEILSHRDRSSDRVADAALAELEQAAADERPFFLFAHFFDPHYDYVPPAPYDTRFDPDYGGELDGKNFLSNPELSRPDPLRPGKRVQTASERDLEHVRALYSGELAWADEQVGRLLGRLAELGLEDDTLVVVVSDHGDEFFEHGGLGHRSTLHDEVIAVPLLLRFPGRTDAGATSSRTTSLMDVAPTVLELLDLPSAGASMAGRSFARELRGEGDVASTGPSSGALSRLVTHSVTGFELRGHVYEGLLITVQESFRTDEVVVHRSRRWAEPLTGLPSAVQEEFRAQQERSYAQEELTWTGLDDESSPSADFDAPAPRAALVAFRAEYERLAALRTVGAAAGEDVAFRAELEALGYVGSVGVERQGWLVLPLPGEAWFEEASR